jgi:hypothetical protein
VNTRDHMPTAMRNGMTATAIGGVKNTALEFWSPLVNRTGGFTFS